jgi:hypothetical protein
MSSWVRQVASAENPRSPSGERVAEWRGSAGEAASAARCAPSALSSPGVNSRPVSPARMSAGTPPTREETVGRCARAPSVMA